MFKQARYKYNIDNLFKQIRTKGNNHQNVMEERKMGKYT